MAGAPITMGCTQEAPLFRAIGAQGDADVNFVNLREHAGCGLVLCHEEVPLSSGVDTTRLGSEGQPRQVRRRMLQPVMIEQRGMDEAGQGGFALGHAFSLGAQARPDRIAARQFFAGIGPGRVTL